MGNQLIMIEHKFWCLPDSQKTQTYMKHNLNEGFAKSKDWRDRKAGPSYLAQARWFNNHLTAFSQFTEKL